MPKPRPSFEEQVADLLLQGWDEEADAVARELGLGPNAIEPSEKELAEQYFFQDERYPDAAQLVALGYSPEEATGMKYPYRFRLFTDYPVAEQVRFVKRLNRIGEKLAAEGWMPPTGVPEGAAADVLSGAQHGPDAPPELAPGGLPPDPMAAAMAGQPMPGELLPPQPGMPPMGMPPAGAPPMMPGQPAGPNPFASLLGG